MFFSLSLLLSSGLSSPMDSGGNGKAGWLPFVFGCVALYFLFKHIPFHITIS